MSPARLLGGDKIECGVNRTEDRLLLWGLSLEAPGLARSSSCQTEPLSAWPISLAWVFAVASVFCAPEFKTKSAAAELLRPPRLAYGCCVF
jgi:hypothetical protein